MKFCGRVFRLYCTVCGLLVTPVVLAVALAHSMGVLPVHKIQAVFADGTPPVTLPRPVVVIDDAEDGDGPVDPRLWRRRLAEMSERVETRSRELKRSHEEVRQQQRNVTAVSDALAAVLTTLLQEAVDGAGVVAAPDRFVRRLEERRSRRARLPHLVQTVGTMEPRAVAKLLARTGELDDDLASEILGALPPRKTAEVLSEMGRIDPQRGARLMAHLGSHWDSKD